jgi:L-fuconate dehydratase
VKAVAFRYITDVITPDEALTMLKEKEAAKAEREKRMLAEGYPAYVTSAGWIGAPCRRLYFKSTTVIRL